MKRVIFTLILIVAAFGGEAFAQNQISPIEFDQIGSTPQYTMTVDVPCGEKERPITKSYDATTRTWTIGAVPAPSLPAMTHTITYSGSVVPVVGLGYSCEADTTFKKKRVKSYVIYDD